MVKVREDMTGWVMSEHGIQNSRLTVIRQTEDHIDSYGRRVAQWLCECNCEQHTLLTAVGSKIKNGYKLSCGCYTKERILDVNKKYNVFSEKLCDSHGEYYIGYTSNTNNEFYIDAEDYENVKNYCWSETYNKGFRRLVSTINGKSTLLHQFLGFKGYDHIDRNELNNRKYNLRPCTQKENCRNSSKRKDNTSGITGVYWRKDREKWVANIICDNKYYGLGCFLSKEDAIKARLQAEVKYFGEFAPQKHLFQRYGIDCNIIDTGEVTI